MKNTRKRKMKKALKITGKVLLLLLIVLVVLIGGIFIYNRIMLASEKSLTENPIGQYVEVDGHRMNIYTEVSSERSFDPIWRTEQETPPLSCCRDLQKGWIWF